MENWRSYLNEEPQEQISSNLELYYKLFPRAKNEKLREFYSSESKIIKLNAQVALKDIIDGYLNNFQSFKRLVMSLPGFEDRSEDDIKNVYTNSVGVLEKRLRAAPVKVFLDDIDRFSEQDLANALGFYIPENKTIYVNPFKIYKAGGKFSSVLRYTLKEEYLHLAQDVLSSLKMPTHQLVWQKAKKMGLILPKEKTDAKDLYDYFANNPMEFHAKLWHLKDTLRKHMSQAFDETGRIDSNVLSQLIKNPKGIELEILKIIDPTKIDEMATLFDMVAKVDIKKPVKATA